VGVRVAVGAGGGVKVWVGLAVAVGEGGVVGVEVGVEATRIGGVGVLAAVGSAAGVFSDGDAFGVGVVGGEASFWMAKYAITATRPKKTTRGKPDKSFLPTNDLLQK
jgi:hypothetical protein